MKQHSKKEIITKWFESALELEPAMNPEIYSSLLEQAYSDFSAKSSSVPAIVNSDCDFDIVYTNIDTDMDTYQSHLIMCTYNGIDNLKKNFKSLVDNLNKVSEDVLFTVYLDASSDGSEEYIKEVLSNSYLTFSIRIIKGSSRCGHLKGLKYALKGIKSIVSGYIDDDAIPMNYSLNHILLQAHKFGSAAGTCVDDTSNTSPLGSVLFLTSNSKILSSLPDKLMYHGGGGVTLVKTKLFVEAVNNALNFSCLLGPMLSGVAFKHGIIPYSKNQLLTHHPNRTNIREWVYMIGKYRDSWNKVYKYLGEDGYYFRRLYKSHTYYREIMIEHLLGMDVHQYRFLRALRKLVDDELIKMSDTDHRLNYL